MKSITLITGAALTAATFVFAGCDEKSGDSEAADTATESEGDRGSPGTTQADDTGSVGTPGDDETGDAGSDGPSGSGDDTDPSSGLDTSGETLDSGAGADDTGPAGPGGEPGGPAGPGPADDTGGSEPGDDTAEPDSPGGPGSEDTGGTTGPGGDTAIAAVAFYVNGLVEGSGASQTFTGAYGVIAYGVDSLYVNFDDYLCAWYATSSALGTPSDCPTCEYSFEVSFDTPVEDGSGCDAIDEGLGPYGYTGAEVFVVDTRIGFEKAGSASYGGFDYDYGYLEVYSGYPYYAWYDSTSFSTVSYPYYYDATATVLYAIDGYYGVVWSP